MKLKLVRGFLKGKTFTEGKLYIDDVFECYTIEDEDRLLEVGGKKVQNLTAIPRGMYKVVMSMSNRFNKLLPEVLQVPGFTGVRIHAGNSSKDTEGCIIVGSINTSVADDFIGASKVALAKLLIKINREIKAGNTVTLEII